MDKRPAITLVMSEDSRLAPMQLPQSETHRQLQWEHRDRDVEVALAKSIDGRRDIDLCQVCTPDSDCMKTILHQGLAE